MANDCIAMTAWGPKAEIEVVYADFCFTLKADVRVDITASPLSAKADSCIAANSITQ